MEFIKKTHDKVLVVDDEDMIITVVKRVLSTAGIEVLSAENGAEAIEVCKESGPEIGCILLDFGLPDYQTEKLVDDLTEINQNTAIFIMSGHSEKSIKNSFTNGMPCGYIAKPFTTKELIQQVQDSLSKK